MKRAASSATLSNHCAILIQLKSKAMELAKLWLEPLKLWAQINLSPLSLFVSDILSQWRKTNPVTFSICHHDKVTKVSLYLFSNVTLFGNRIIASEIRCSHAVAWLPLTSYYWYSCIEIMFGIHVCTRIPCEYEEATHKPRVIPRGHLHPDPGQRGQGIYFLRLLASRSMR